MKSTKKISDKDFLQEELNEEELKTVIGGIDYDDITEKSFEELISKNTDSSKKTS